jgi:hypothetical protein
VFLLSPDFRLDKIIEDLFSTDCARTFRRISVCGFNYIGFMATNGKCWL